MNSRGKLRNTSICSELTAEIVKVAQISKSLGPGKSLSMKRDDRKTSIAKLKQMQKEGLVLDVSTENVSPAELEKTLIVKHGFEIISVMRSQNSQALNDKPVELDSIIDKPVELDSRNDKPVELD